MKLIDEADLRRAGEMIDHWGQFWVRRTPNRPIPVVQINSKGNPDLAWLADLTGVEQVDRWTVTGTRAGIVLVNVEPYLLVKRQQARVAISLARDLRYLGSVVNDMALLGWRIPRLEPHPKARVPLIEAS